MTNFDLGTFEGFNFRTQSAIERTLTAEEVINWEHDQHGEAEFWPAGDNAGVSVVFRNRTAVTGSELTLLDELLASCGDDSMENMLRVYFAVNLRGHALDELTAEQLVELDLYIFMGSNFLDVRRDAAYELFETYFPELYKAWESTPCDGLIFDTDRFIDSPSWSTDEIDLGSDGVALLISNW